MDYDLIISRSKDPELKAQLRDQKRRLEQIILREQERECEIEYHRDLGRDQLFNPEAICTTK